MPERIAELDAKAADPAIYADQKAAKVLFAELRGLKKQWEPLLALISEADTVLELAKTSDIGDLPAIQAEADKLFAAWKTLETQLYLAGEFDQSDCYLTISAGAGGTEAQDWAAILVRMYMRYCERQGFKMTMLDKTDGQEAGIKTGTFLIEGTPAYGYLKCEKGTHRLVRISPFGAKGLRQTSFALVEALPVIEGATEIQIDPKDLRVDTFRSGGAGGQHVNKTESAIRITHLPTNTVVSCQTERNQLQNRERAMQMLQSKLLALKRAEEEATKTELKGARESADFGQQIRSYVLHPYQMVKDLRTDVETSQTQDVLDGDIQAFIDAELKRAAREGKYQH